MALAKGMNTMAAPNPEKPRTRPAIAIAAAAHKSRPSTRSIRAQISSGIRFFRPEWNQGPSYGIEEMQNKSEDMLE
jgi:hypothetical protein